MKFILGKKENMVEYFDESGQVHPATLISAGPITVTQVKNKEIDGYSSLQVGYGTQKKQRVSKAVLGHTKEPYMHLKEFRLSENDLTFILNDAQVKYVFVSGEDIYRKVKTVSANAPGVKEIYAFNNIVKFNFIIICIR